MSQQQQQSDDSEEQSSQPNGLDNAAVEVLAEATPMRAIHRLINPLVDECRWHLSDDGLRICAVDPANVGMVELEVDADGFKSYRFDREVTFGMNHGSYYGPRIQYARMNVDDPVKLSFSEDRCSLRVTRPDQRVQRQSDWSGIDPDSIREEPDLPNLDMPWYAKPEEPKSLSDVAREMKDSYDHVAVTADGYNADADDESATLVLSNREEADDGEVLSEDVFRFTDAAEFRGGKHGDPDSRSLFSLDYFKDMAVAVHKAKMDRVTIRWGDEFPTKLYFEQNDWGFSGTFMLAPRIQSE